MYHAFVENVTWTPVHPNFGMTQDQLLMVAVVVVLVATHIVSRMIVDSIYLRRAYRRALKQARAERALFEAQNLTCDVKEKDVRR